MEENKKNINEEDSKKEKGKTRKKKEKDISIVEEQQELSENESQEIIKEVIIEKKVGFNYLEVILIMIIMLVLGGLLGRFITYFERRDNSSDDDNKQVVENVSSEFKEFIDTYNDIRENYYEEVDKEKLLDAGIKGMLEYLDDDYSLYMNQEETETFNEQVEGKYVGIGVEIQQIDDTISISRIFNNTPAYKSGLKAGDQIIKVDDEDIMGKTASEVSSMIKENSKKEVTVRVLRNDKELDFKIALEQVEIESVYGEIIEKDGKNK